MNFKKIMKHTDKIMTNLKKSNKKLEIDTKNILEDIDKVMSYANDLNTLDIENINLDKMEKEINSLGIDFKDKYKKYLSKDNLDSKE